MARIEVSDLHRLISSGAAPLIVDVRSATAVALEPRSIPGAVRVRLNEVKDRLLGMPREREIVSYCTCPNEVSAAEVAKILMDSGFRRVRPYVAASTPGSPAGYASRPHPECSTRRPRCRERFGRVNAPHTPFAARFACDTANPG